MATETQWRDKESHEESGSEEGSHSALLSDDARRLFDEGRKEEALKYLSEKFKELEREKRDIIAYIGEKKWTEKDIAHVLRQQASICNNMGFIFEDLGDNEKALKMYMRGSELNPLDAVVLSNAGVIFHKSGRPEQAMTMYRRSLSLNNQNVPARYRLANLLFLHFRDPVTAERELRTCISQDRYFLPAYADLARILVEKPIAEKREEAIQLTDFMIQHRGSLDDFTGHYAKAYILSQLKQYEEAITVYESIVQRNEHDIVAILNLAMLLERLERTEEALRYANLAFEIDPRNPETVFILQRVLERVGRAGESEHLLNEMLKADDRNEMVYQSLVSLMLRQRRSEEAEQLVAEGERKHPDMQKHFNMMREMIRANKN